MGTTDKVDQGSNELSDAERRAEERREIEARLKDEPDSAAAWYSFALQCDDKTQAIAAYRTAVNCDKKAREQIAQRLADLDLKAVEKSELLDRSKKSLAAHAGALGMLFSYGFKDEATQGLKELRAAYPDNHDLSDEMVAIFAYEGRFDEACEEYAKYDSGVRGPIMTAEHAAWHVALGVQYAIALPMAEWVMSRWPASSRACCCASFCHLHMGQTEDAITFAREAIRRQPRDPDAWFFLGWATHVAGDKATALSLLRTALDIDPKHYDSKGLMGEIVSEHRNSSPSCE